MATRADEIRAELIRRELARRRAQPAAQQPEAASSTEPGSRADRYGARLGEAMNIDEDVGRAVKGVADVAQTMATSSVNIPARWLAGLGGAINPNDTYNAAYAREAAGQKNTLIGDSSVLSKPGARLAEGIGAGLETTGIPQVLNAAGRGINSVLGPTAGPIVKDTLESGLTLASFGVPVTRFRPPGNLARAVTDAEQLGYVTPGYAPIGRAGERAGGPVERTMEAAATDTADAAKSLHNQNITDRLLARAGRLDSEYVTPEALELTVARAEAPFEDVRRTGLSFAADNDYLKAVRDMTGSQHRGAGARLPIDDAVSKLQASLRDARVHTTDSLVDQIGVLRSQGFRALGGVDDAAALRGAAMLKGADALEGLLERGLERAALRAQTTSPAAAVLLRRLIAQYRDGRAWRSDLHIIQESMAPGGTGVIDAGRLGRIEQRREGLNNPILQRVAQVAQNFPEVVTPLHRAARGDVRTGLSAAGRNEAGALGATIGRLLSRTSLALAKTRRAGSARSRVRAGTRAASVLGARAAALNNFVEEETP